MKILTWGIYLVVFSLPLYLVRFTLLNLLRNYLTGFKIFGIPTTVLELMIYVLFVVWLISKIKNQLFLRSFKKLIFNSVFIPLGLILIGVSLATIFSSDLRTSAGIWKAWFIDPILFFIVLVDVIKTESQIRKVLYSLFLSGTIVSIIALIYLVFGKLNSSGRLQAFYNSPNYLAMYLAPALLIGVGKIIPHTFVLLPVIFLLLSIFFTKSFAAWIGIIAAIGFGLFIYLLRTNKKFCGIVLIPTLIIILFLSYFALTQRESSFDARLIIWQKALEIFKNNPILGIGPGTFGNYFPPYPEWGVSQPHNIFLAFLLQTGIIGFMGFIWLLVWFFRAGFKNLALFDNARLNIVVIMVYILVHGLLDTTYWKNDLSVLFWIIVGLMVGIGNKAFRHLRGRNFF